MPQYSDILKSDETRDDSKMLHDNENNFAEQRYELRDASDNLIASASSLLEDDESFSDSLDSNEPIIYQALRPNERRAFKEMRSKHRHRAIASVLAKTSAGAVMAATVDAAKEDMDDKSVEEDEQEKLERARGYAARIPLRSSRKHARAASYRKRAAAEAQALKDLQEFSDEMLETKTKSKRAEAKLKASANNPVKVNSYAWKQAKREAKTIAARQGVSKHQALRSVLQNSRYANVRRPLSLRIKRAFQRTFGTIPAKLGGAVLGLCFPILILLLILAIVLGVIASSNDNYSLEGLSDTEQQVATYFFSKGLSNTSVAAIMGNIRGEVGGSVGEDLDVDAIQDGHTCLAPDSYANCSPNTGGAAHGLFQLEADGRFQALNDLAVSLDTTWRDLETQCEYIYQEMPSTFDTHSNKLVYYSEIYGSDYDGIAGVGYYMSFEDWCEITDLDWATEAFCRIVERAGKPHMDQRQSYAQQYYDIFTSGALSSDSEVVQRAYAELGKPYLWGASGPNAFDCSGLVGYCLTGIYGNHWCTTSSIMTWPQISADEAQPGDIVVNATHTGIYIGNGQMIHAPSTGDVVKISNVYSNMIYVRYSG